MTDVRLIDVSLRDGNQSLWGAVGVTTRTIEQLCPLLDQCGYEAIDIVSSTIMAAAVRFHREDPWQRLDLARRLAPNTRLGFLTTGRRFVTFSRTPKVVLRLAYSLLRRHGITRMWVADPMLDMASTIENATMAKEEGFEEVIAGISYTSSPVHTDEYYADKIAELDGCDSIDAIYLKDPCGLLSPERLESLLPKLQSRLTRLRIDEIHSHCTIGLAPMTLLKAADLGLTKLHCALPPLANGNSHSNALQLVRNLAARGHRVSIDPVALERASACLRREAALFALPGGAPADYDEAYYQHTLPGGVLTTAERQLAEMGRAEMMPAVVEESIQVRADLGWPIAVTPFAQYIVTQASINVITGERYRRITDEVVDLLLGEFGPMPGAVDPNLRDRAMATGRAKRARITIEPTLDDIKAKFGLRLADEDLLLRAVMPADEVDAMVRRRQSERGSLGSLLSSLEDDKGPWSLSLTTGGSTVSFAGGGAAR
ncbi:MAG: pyruvate/oxaloacetate carboxyltransferase [Alphaproteobacteria bacterium]|nr:pyruvate/oxaloacetate carboxyltransferase [Alphaproteobacteria bacterium]